MPMMDIPNIPLTYAVDFYDLHIENFKNVQISVLEILTLKPPLRTNLVIDLFCLLATLFSISFLYSQKVGIEKKIVNGGLSCSFFPRDYNLKIFVW